MVYRLSLLLGWESAIGDPEDAVRAATEREGEDGTDCIAIPVSDPHCADILAYYSAKALKDRSLTAKTVTRLTAFAQELRQRAGR